MTDSPKEVKININELFTEEEIKQIRLFLKRAKELSKTPVITAGSKISMNIYYEKKKGTRFSVTLPSEEDLRLFYMAFRFFYLKKEPTHFLTIANLVNRKLEDPLIRDYIKWLKDMWRGALARQQVRVGVNRQELHSHFLIDIWFNSHYFHSDKEKDKKLSKIKEVLTEDATRFMLADAVFQATKAVLRLAHALQDFDKIKEQNRTK
jgi:hypothetical protein